jgi:hypothetical protein
VHISNKLKEKCISIQYLFIYLLSSLFNSLKANIDIGMKKERNEKHIDKTKMQQGNMYHLDINIEEL